MKKGKGKRKKKKVLASTSYGLTKKKVRDDQIARAPWYQAQFESPPSIVFTPPHTYLKHKLHTALNRTY